MSKLKTLYDRDFVAWSREQADALRAAGRARVDERIDWENLAEEIESLGKSDKRELGSRIRQIIEHLVKIRLSPSVEPRANWRASIRQQRAEIADLLQASPSLRTQIEDIIREQTPRGCINAVNDLEDRGELNRAQRQHLKDGPDFSYTTDQILGDWFPAEPGQSRK